MKLEPSKSWSFSDMYTVETPLFKQYQMFVDFLKWFNQRTMAFLTFFFNIFSFSLSIYIYTYTHTHVYIHIKLIIYFIIVFFIGWMASSSIFLWQGSFLKLISHDFFPKTLGSFAFVLPFHGYIWDSWGQRKKNHESLKVTLDPNVNDSNKKYMLSVFHQWYTKFYIKYFINYFVIK